MKTGRMIRALGLATVAGLVATLPTGAMGEPDAVSERAVAATQDGHVGGEMRDAGMLLRLDSMSMMHVTSTGRAIEVDPTSVQGSQPQFVSTHTDADFTGGTFIAQGGFAEDEFAGATYNIPNSLFPIRIDIAEMIFAVQNAHQPTTTQWAIQIYDGEPSQGQGALVANFNSVLDGLPPIQLPAGSAGVNVLFQVDPSDPQQIVIPKDPNLGANDDHKVTLAYGIIEHNQPSPNACLIAPNNCCNAFPVTDISGLSTAQLNWIDSIPCGSIICPTGGWFRFSQISSLCRPSGDWVMRLTWTSLAEPCLGDADQSGNVDVDDLNLVLANWFTPQLIGTNGDVTGNGFVNVDDLNLVLSNWSNICL